MSHREKTLETQLFEKRILVLTGEVNQVSADILMKAMLLLDNENHNDITLYINSPGGSVTDGLQIIDTMNIINSKVNTVVTGMAASMGAAILSCGVKRFALPNATVMVHQVAGGASGRIHDTRVTLKEMERLNDLLLNIIAENCGITPEEYDNMTKVDKYMNAQEALEFGIVDEIINKKDKRN